MKYFALQYFFKTQPDLHILAFLMFLSILYLWILRSLTINNLFVVSRQGTLFIILIIIMCSAVRAEWIRFSVAASHVHFSLQKASFSSVKVLASGRRSPAHYWVQQRRDRVGHRLRPHCLGLHGGLRRRLLPGTGQQHGQHLHTDWRQECLHLREPEVEPCDRLHQQVAGLSNV